MNDTESVGQIASVLVEATQAELQITPESGVSFLLKAIGLNEVFLIC